MSKQIAFTLQNFYLAFMCTAYKNFETERLLLRPTSLQDAPFVLKLLNSPKWIEFIGDRNVHTVEEAAAYIQNRMIPQLERLGYGNYLVINNTTNEIMGNCGLYERSGLPVVDIGFAFLPEYEGKGYGFEAASRILLAAKETFRVPKVCAITTTKNYTSQKLLDKLGLIFIKKMFMDGDPEELMYYEMIL